MKLAEGVTIFGSGKRFDVARQLLSILLIVVSLGAVGWFAYQAIGSGLSFHNLQYSLFIGAAALYLAVLVALPFLWQQLLCFLSQASSGQSIKPDRVGLLKAYGRSWLAKYIPGRIWTFGGRWLLATKVGVPAKIVARSMALEILFSYGTLTVLGIAFAILGRSNVLVASLALLTGIVMMAVVMYWVQKFVWSGGTFTSHEGVLWRVVRFARTLLAGDGPLELKHIVWGIAAYGLYSLLQIVFVILLAESFVDLSLTEAATIAGGWALGVTVGYFAFITPGGLGVREGVALVVFSQVLDAPTAALIVAASRIVSIGVDVVFVFTIEALAAGLLVGRRITQGSSRYHPAAPE